MGIRPGNKTTGRLNHIKQRVEYIVEKVEKRVKGIEKMADELEKRISGSDDEPIPPNPETATKEEVEIYKKAVRDAGNRLPRG